MTDKKNLKNLTEFRGSMIPDREKKVLEFLEKCVQECERTISPFWESFFELVEDFNFEVCESETPLQFIVKNYSVHAIYIEDIKNCDICYDNWKSEAYFDYNEYCEENCDLCGLKSIPNDIGKLVSLKFLIINTNEKIRLPSSINERSDLKILISSDEVELNAFNLHRQQKPNPKKKDLVDFKFASLPQYEVDALKDIEDLYGKITLGREFEVKDNCVIKLVLNRKDIRKLPDTIKNFVNLEVLDLSFNNNLTSLPELISQLINLKTLNLTYTMINKLPESFGNLLNLEKLSFQHNQLEKLPESFGNLKNLKSLDLNHNKFRRLPDSFAGLINLKYLKFGSTNLPKIVLKRFGGLLGVKYPQSLVKYIQLKNKGKKFNYVEFKDEKYPIIDNQLALINLNIKNISDIKDLEKMVNLKKIDLSHNQITEITGLEKLTSLECLDISFNQISAIRGLDFLNNLRELNIKSNKITMIRGLENLKSLKLLNLDDNKITMIRGLENLKSLESLNLDSNKISEIRGLENLDSLKELKIKSFFLSNDKIKLLGGYEDWSQVKYPQKLVAYCKQNLNPPDNILNLKGVDYEIINGSLQLRGLDITSISEIIGLEKLFQLRKLDLSENNISKIIGLEDLINLTELDVSSNELTEISGLKNLVNLKKLNLQNNHIYFISGLESLKNLEDLNLANNEIVEIMGFEHLKSLRNIHIEGNNIPDKVLENFIGFYSGRNKYILNPQKFIEFCQNNKNIKINYDFLKDKDIITFRNARILRTEAELLREIEKELVDEQGISFKFQRATTFDRSNFMRFKAIYNKIVEIRLVKGSQSSGWGVKLNRFPEALTKFRYLKKLLLGSNNITSLPDSIGDLQSLETLSLGHNKIKKESNFNLKSLKHLDLQSNYLTKIPDSIFKIKSLKSLNISYNIINLLPKIISNLFSLESLIANSCNLSSIPESIKSLVLLKELQLEGNSFTAFPESILTLRNLEILFLNESRLLKQKRRISKIPEKINQLRNLKKLNLGRHMLRTLPNSICELKSLKELSIRENYMIKLPESIGDLSSLKKLDLGYNFIEHLPDSIKNLKNIEFLNLEGNKLHKNRSYCFPHKEMFDKFLVEFGLKRK